MTVDEALEWADRVADDAPGATHEAILAAEVRRLRAERDELRAALNEMRLNSSQAYCSDQCLCAARDMRNLAHAALSRTEGKEEI